MAELSAQSTHPTAACRRVKRAYLKRESFTATFQQTFVNATDVLAMMNIKQKVHHKIFNERES
jgi:hypothetical protein